MLALSQRAGKAAQRPIGERIGKFVREVRAELRKVVWPNRKELITYTTVVVVTVLIVSAMVGLVDLLLLFATRQLAI